MTEKDLLTIVSELEDTKKEKIDLKELLFKYVSHWRWFVLALLVFGTLAALYARYATPEYAITSKILIREDKNGPDPAGAGIFNDLDFFNNSKNVLNEIEALKSQSLIERVLRKLSISCSYYLKGSIKDLEIYGSNVPIRVVETYIDSTAYNRQFYIRLENNKSFELGEVDDNGDISKWEKHDFDEEITKSYAIFSIKAMSDITKLRERKKEIIVYFNDIPELAKIYLEKIEIEMVNENASVLQLALQSTIPEKGKDMLNNLVKLYNKENIADKNFIAANTVEFIDERLNYLMSDLTGVEKSVEEFKKDNELTDVSSEASMYLEEASDYNKQLAEIELNLDVLTSIETYLKSDKTQYSPVPGSVSMPDPSLQQPISKFNELLLERQRMLRTLPEENPLVQNIDDQLAYLRTNIAQNLENVKRNLKIKKKNISASSVQFASRIGKVPTMERQLLEINRQQGVKENLYLYLLQKREESSLSVVSAVSNSQIIDPATSSIDPVRPRKMLIFGFALLMAICTPIGLLYVRDILDDKVRTRKEIEKSTSAPILGELPHSSTISTHIASPKSSNWFSKLFRSVSRKLSELSLRKKNQDLRYSGGASSDTKPKSSNFITQFFRLLTGKISFFQFLNRNQVVDYGGEKSRIVVTAESRNPIAEVFRLIRSNLRYLSLGKKNQVIMVTSSMSGEGKTFFSINFAASMALLGKNVLIVDFDFRRPNVSKSLDLSKEVGVVDYLVSDDMTIDELITPLDSIANLSVLGSGAIPPNPNELMASEKVHKLMEELRENFEYIIIDTAPVGLVADALLLDPYIDSSVYIVRYDATYKAQLDILKDVHENKKLKNLMLVPNDKKDEAYVKYAYGHYAAH